MAADVLLAGRGLQAELVYALLGMPGSVLQLEAEEWAVAMPVSAAEREAILRCVAPGAAYARCRARCEAMVEASGSCARRAVAMAAMGVLDDYAAAVAEAEAEVSGCCEVVDGLSALRGRLGPWTEVLESVGGALEAIRDLKGGQVVDALRRRRDHGEAGAAGRRLTMAAEGVVLRQLCAWCTAGETVDPFEEFFIRVVDDGMRTCETRERLVPTSMLSSAVVEGSLFAGGALRVVREADRRAADARKVERFAPPEAEAEVAVRKWASLTRRYATSSPRHRSNAADAIAEVIRLDRELAALVDQAKVAAAAALLATVEAAGLSTATEAMCGVGLLRAGALWQRALDLAALSAEPDDNALVIQGALEEAARDLGGGGADAAARAVAADGPHSILVVRDPASFALPRGPSPQFATVATTWIDDGCRLHPGASVVAEAARRLDEPWRSELVFEWLGRSDRGLALELRGRRSARVFIGDGNDDAPTPRLCVFAATKRIAVDELRRLRDGERVSLTVNYSVDDADHSKRRLEIECSTARGTLAAISFLADVRELLGRAEAVVGLANDGRCPVLVEAWTFSCREHHQSWRQALRLEARLAWPLPELFFDAQARADYDRCFRRLVGARLAATVLDDAWRRLAAGSRLPLPRDAQDRAQARRFWTLHARAAHLVRSLASWLQRDVVEAACRRLQADLPPHAPFADVRTAHADFRLGLQQALLVDDAAVDDALDNLANFAARLATFVAAHADHPEDAPASVLANLECAFKRAAARLFRLPQLWTPLGPTADFSDWFHHRLLSSRGDNITTRILT